MSARSPASDLFPVAAVGVAILALGGLLLLIGAGTSVGNPSEFDTWLVGVGLVLLLGAMLVVLIRAGPPAKKPAASTSPDPEPVDPPAASRSPVETPPSVTPPRAAPESEPANPPSVSRRAVEAAAPPSPSTPARPAPSNLPDPTPPAREARIPIRFPGSTSIPAQYEDVRNHVPVAPGPEFEWEEGEIGMSLPFAAGSKNAVPAPTSVAGQPGGAPFSPVGFLEREVERLRERVHELERTGGPPDAPAAPTMRTTPTLASVPTRVEFRPVATSAATTAIGSRRECTSCGAGLPGGATDPLCWGCGRPLCSTCYWRAKEGASAHTCPTCFAKAGTTSLSGGRASPLSATTSVAPNPRPKAATARR